MITLDKLVSKRLKLTSHGILPYFWSAELSKSFYQLIVSIFPFLNQQIIMFSQHFFSRFKSVGLPHTAYVVIH